MSNILEEVQQYVADKLNADPQLSACHFIAENRRDVEFEIKQALGKQGVVGLVMTPKATFAGAYMDTSLAWQLDELEVDIVENVLVNRGKKDGGYITGQDAAMRLFDVLCPLSGEGEGKFCPVSYDEGEDGSLLVNKCILKCLVHVSESEPPAPWFPDRQAIKMSDGTVIPMGDGFFSPSGYDINTTLRTLGYTTDDVAEIYVFSKLESTTAYREHLKAVYIDSSCPSIGRDYWSQPFSGSSLEKVVFRGRTYEEVEAMAYYPWGITDTSKIVAEPNPTTTVARYTDGSVLELNLSGIVQDHDVPKKNGEADLASVQMRFPVSALGTRAFNACWKLSAVSMPSSLSSIGREAFQTCSSLVSVEVPSAVTHLDLRTFYMCTSLSSITLPSQLSGIGVLALGNTAIAELPKLESLSYINSRAFMDCHALTYMCIPQQTQIQQNAFENCPSLTCLAFEGKTEQEVQAMQYYPWGIEDTSVISAELG